jgi:tRNA (cmo5U34)-methyltransferase
LQAATAPAIKKATVREETESFMAKDILFSERRDEVRDFDFGKDTAVVFDDMLGRSVPYYGEMQRMIAEISADYAIDGSQIYDLGCATCNAFFELDRTVPKNVRLVGVDFSNEMLDQAREKLSQRGFQRDYQLICADLNDEIEIYDASVVIMNLTLQFIRPVRRDRIMRKIATGMTPGGCLLVVEKVLSKDSKINRSFIKYYYDFKQRNGYSQMEIAQKREALENILIPYRLEDNYELFLNSGFSACDVFFKWYNFCGIIAVK